MTNNHEPLEKQNLSGNIEEPQMILPTIKIELAEHFKDRQGYLLPSEYEPNVQKIVPFHATEGSAGIDLRADVPHGLSLIISPGETQLVDTGFVWNIPAGHVGMVCSRSGLALKNSVFVLNAPGIIDSDYRGEVKVILHNAGKQDFIINNGDRIAQMVVIISPNLALVRTDEPPKQTDDWAPLTAEDRELLAAMNTPEETTRGTGGFGSTGLK